MTAEPVVQPEAELVAEALHILCADLLRRGCLLSDLIDGAEINLAAMKMAALALIETKA